MQYNGKPILANPALDPGDLYLITVTFGHQLMVMMDYTHLILGMPQQTTSHQARLVTWFCALCATRMADVVDYDGYPGDVAAEQLADYSIQWPDTEEGKEGCEAVLFVERMRLLQDEHIGLNFIDLLTGQVCTEFLLFQAAESKGEDIAGVPAPLLRSLAVVDDPDVAVLTRLIDHLLYTAGVPLKTERYVLKTGSGETHIWSQLMVGAVSDTFEMMDEGHHEDFLSIRQSPVDMPVGQSTSCVGSNLYSIHLVKEPDDEFHPT